MKKIKGFQNISSTDYNTFNDEFVKGLEKLQADNQEVEVRYKVNNFDNGQLVYSALLLGRVEA